MNDHAQRLLAALTSVPAALLASDRAKSLGQLSLSDALWCHSRALRVRGYPRATAMYEGQRDRYLAECEPGEVDAALREVGR